MLNRILLSQEVGSVGRATLTLVRWRNGDHLGRELLIKIPGVRLRCDLRLEGRAELQEVGVGYRPCSALPGAPGPRYSSPPRRQACGQAFPCLGALALQGPTCRAAHLTLGPGHQWPGSVRLQRTHHCRGFEGNFKGPGLWEEAKTPVCSTLDRGQDCLGTSSN